MEDVEIERTDDEPQRAKYAIQVKTLTKEVISWKPLRILTEDIVWRWSSEPQLLFDSICSVRNRCSFKDINKSIKSGPREQGATFTVEDAVETLGFGKYQFRLSILTGMAWMADAMELMILSIIAPALR